MKTALPLDWPTARQARRPLQFSSPNCELLPKPPRFVIDRVPVDRVPMDYAVAWIVHGLKNRRSLAPLMIVGPNAQLVTLAGQDPQFAEALQAADLSVPDGISVVLASRLLGQPIPERVTGG